MNGLLVSAILCAYAAGEDETWSEQLLEALVADASHAERTSRLTMALGAADRETVDQITAALAVVTALSGNGVDDSERVRAYLVAALCDDAATRASVRVAALTGSEPPVPPQPVLGVDDFQFGAGVLRAEERSTERFDSEATFEDEANAVFEARSLWRDTTVDPWVVRQGPRDALSPLAFADRVRDWDGRARIERQWATSVGTGVGVAVGGGLLSGIGTALATLGDADRGRVVGGVVLGAAGLGAVIGGTGVVWRGVERRRIMARNYEAEEVDRFIRTFNDSLRDELMLDEDP